jgi:hypothetical protein
MDSKNKASTDNTRLEERNWLSSGMGYIVIYMVGWTRLGIYPHYIPKIVHETPLD